MSYQFLHVESYSRVKSKQGAGKLNVAEVIAEANRDPGNCPHVEHPKPPVPVFGDLKKVEVEVQEWAGSMTDARGHKLRKDAQCLLAGVISLPREQEEDWEAFKKASLLWLKKKYGNTLKAVVAHEDEAHPHLHFYCVPEKGERFESIHEGKAAALLLKQEKKGVQNLAYIQAMRGLQDDFGHQVGQRFGLTRLGPGRRRLTRAQHQAEKAQAKALAYVEKTAKARQKHYKKVGLEAGRREALDLFFTAGEKLGAVVSSALNRWHKPSNEALERAEKAEEKAKKAETEKAEIKKRLTALADQRVSKVAGQLQEEKARREGVEKELLKAEKKLEDLSPTPELARRKKIDGPS